MSKQISVRKALILIVACILITSLIVYVYASPSASTFWITEGIYPSAYSYTFWKEGSTYYTKDAYGRIPTWGESTNVSSLAENAQNNLPHPLGSSLYAGTLYFKEGLYSFSTDFKLLPAVSLLGDGKENTIFEFTDASSDGLVLPETYYGVSVENVMIINTRALSVGNALYFNKTQYARVSNVEIRGNWERGIYLRNAIGNYLIGIEVQGRGITDPNIINGVVLYDTTHQNTFLNVVVRGCNRSVYLGNAVDHNRFIAGEYGYAGYPSITPNTEAFYLTTNTKWNIFDGVWIEHIDTAFSLQSGANNNTFITNLIEDVNTKVVDNGLGNRFYWNFNYVTQNSGNATISASTSVTFNHGLQSNATFVSASFNSTSVDGWTWTSTSTQITITVTPSGSYIVYWDAQYQP